MAVPRVMRVGVSPAVVGNSNGLQWKARTRLMPRRFDVVIERDAEGFYVASVPQIPACHTQARSLDEVTERIREAIELCLEVEGAPEQDLEFIGIQRVNIAA
jgi:predicted RNase H-like HicB family nuclease